MKRPRRLDDDPRPFSAVPSPPVPRSAWRTACARGAMGLALLGAGCGVEPAAPQTGPLTVPFAVSDYFAPTGFMGDGATVGVVTLENGGCSASDRVEGALGDCYKVTYRPEGMWAGVYWQYPPNNWGSKPGMQVLPGATKVSFWAKGSRGGENVTFGVGGLGDDTQPHRDSIRAETSVVLGTEWQRYSIDLRSRPYDAIIGGFSWTARPSPADREAGVIVFFLDGVTWEP